MKCVHCLLPLFKKQASLTKFLKLKRHLQKEKEGKKKGKILAPFLASVVLTPSPLRTPHPVPSACCYFLPVLLEKTSRGQS